MIRFVVGTGECGTALLGAMLAECRPLLSLCEFFTALDPTVRFAAQRFDGKAFASFLSAEAPVLSEIIRRGGAIAEIAYVAGKARSGHPRPGPVPAILATCLPRLVDDPDALFDELVRFARTLARQPLAQHYRQLFNWLTRRTGKEFWLECSRASITQLEALHAFFPEARFLHLHRDGHEAALSMREHPLDRAAVAARQAQAACGDSMASVARAAGMLVADFGRYWSEQILRGYRGVRRLNGDQYTELRFEDLCSDPAPALQTVAEFFDLPTHGDDWIGRAVSLAQRTPEKLFEKLSADEQHSLAEACQPGMLLLGRAV